MAGAWREQALSLLAAANNHGDLTVKLSSLKQAKDMLLSLVDQSHAAELFTYLLQLQYSPESLVRKSLVKVIEEIGLKAMEYSSILMPVLLTFLKDNEPNVAKQCIITGTNIFCGVLEELQFHRHGIVERWLEELWTWMIKFKDAVFGILLEDGTVGLKLLALKFLEKYVLLFTSSDDSEKFVADAMTCNGLAFNVSWVVGGHPVLDPVALMAEANRYLGVLLDFLRLASSFPGSLTISVVNCLAVIARKRPIHYSSVLSTLLDFDSNFQMVKGGHAASIQYSLRTAFLGFLRCTHPTIVESRDRLLRVMRAMNAGDAADQVMRQVDKMMRFNGRASRDAWSSKDELPLSHLPVSEGLTKKRSIPVDNEELNSSYDVASKRIHYNPNTHAAPPIQLSDSRQDYTATGMTPELPSLDSNLNPVEQMIAMIGALIAEGERGAESLEILISQLHHDLLADIVVTNMKHLPKCAPPLTSGGSMSVTRQSDSSSLPAQVMASIGSTSSTQTPMHHKYLLLH